MASDRWTHATPDELPDLIIAALTGTGTDVDDPALRDALDEAMSIVEGEIDAHADADLARRCQTLVRLYEVRETLADRYARRRLRTFADVHEQLATLRSAGSVDTIVSRAPQAVCQAGNFDRSGIYRVRGSEMLAEASYVRDDPATARELLEYSRAHPAPLQDQILESEMVRRRVPLLVRDALNHPSTYKPMIEHYQTYCYVAAPIMPEGRVIGFIHADKALQHPQDPDGVDEFDRDVLWAFAEGLGYAIERAHMVETLRGQADEVASLMARTKAVVADYLQTRVEMVSDPLDVAAATRTAEAMFATPESAAERKLSRRENEVMELVANGATNGQIASQLFITESTAKAHVGRILRKLGANNRVEAAALYHRSRNA